MTIRTKTLLVAAATAALSVGMFACGAPVKRPDGGVGLLPVGAIAPDVTGTDVKGHVSRLSDARGGRAVVFFYPKDETPGCTKEACAFRDAFTRYANAHVALFGVSRDSDESHQRFLSNHSLPFPLVADPEGTIERAYGVSSTFAMSSRTTFLIAPDGRVERVWPNVDPGVHADEVLAAATTK